MTKTLDNLVDDIYAVIDGNGGWDATVEKFFQDSVADTVLYRLSEGKRLPTLRMSNLGTPCTRKLWYSINKPHTAEPLRPATRLKFLYGDLLESLLLSLCVAAGHDVTGVQTELEIEGIKGHRDCVIDGVVVDIKSASTYSFKKFQSNGLREDDPFGYLSQLSSYVYASRPEGTDPNVGAFLVIDKQHGTICLDKYDLSDYCEGKEQYVRDIKDCMKYPEPLPREYAPEPEGKSGNMKLGTVCSYCDYKAECWPKLRTFIYSTGPVFLTHVEKLPKVPEVTP